MKAVDLVLSVFRLYSCSCSWDPSSLDILYSGQLSAIVEEQKEKFASLTPRVSQESGHITQPGLVCSKGVALPVSICIVQHGSTSNLEWLCACCDQVNRSHGPKRQMCCGFPSCGSELLIRGSWHDAIVCVSLSFPERKWNINERASRGCVHLGGLGTCTTRGLGGCARGVNNPIL